MKSLNVTLPFVSFSIAMAFGKEGRVSPLSYLDMQLSVTPSNFAISSWVIGGFDASLNSRNFIILAPILFNF